jgi:hypothetical protein
MDSGLLFPAVPSVKGLTAPVMPANSPQLLGLHPLGSPFPRVAPSQ